MDIFIFNKKCLQAKKVPAHAVWHVGGLMTYALRAAKFSPQAFGLLNFHCRPFACQIFTVALWAAKLLAIWASKFSMQPFGL